MAKHQLTISPDYVQDWTYVQAIRELFQNALDNQTTNPENELFFNYADEKLTIGNKTSTLTLDTLLLGSSTKRDDAKTIGKHGEGYKVALMVLLRSGKKVTIYNYGAKEVWHTRLIKSRKYNGALITEIDVDKKHFWQSVPSHNLTFVIEGLSVEEYAEIVKTNLHLTAYPKYLKSKSKEFLGNILLDESQKSKIYINGLYVCDNKKFQYGYDIQPQYIKLDRDRKLIDSFDLAWFTSKMWRYVGKEEEVAKMLLAGVYDVSYIKERSTSYIGVEKEIDSKITSHLKESFQAEHGTKSIAVSDNTQLQRVSRSVGSYKPIMVSSAVQNYLKEDETTQIAYIPESPVTSLKEWLERVEDKLTDEEISDFELILEDLK